MKGLLIKDIKLLSIQRNFFLVIIFMGIILPMNTDNIFSVVGYLTIMASILSTSTVSYDEMDNGLPYLMTLPITRKSYVKEKYLFSMLLTTAFWLLSLILALIGARVTSREMDSPLLVLAGAIAIIVMALLFQGLMLPIVITFGGEKSRVAIFLVFGICVLVGVGVTTLGKMLPFDWESIGAALRAIDIRVWIGLGLLLFVILQLISYRISVRQMEKKQF